MSENENINILLNQLNNSESTELTLSDLVTTVHKSLIYSQHNIRDTELEELKRHYEVEVTESGTSYTSKKLNLDDTDKNEGSLTKQNSLTINEVNMKMKVNLDKGELILNPPKNLKHLNLSIISIDADGNKIKNDIKGKISKRSAERFAKQIEIKEQTKFVSLTEQVGVEANIQDDYGSDIINRL